MRRLLSLTAKIAISVLLLYLAFMRVDLSAVATRIQQAKLVWLIAMMVALLVQIGLVTLRWQRISKQCDAPIPIWQGLRYMMIASFFNQTLPSSIGGDAARIWFVARAGAGWKAATYSVIVDRIVGLVVLVAMVVLSLPWLFDVVREPIGRISILLVDIAGIAGTIVFLVLGFARWRWTERWWITRHLADAATVALNLLSNRSNFVTIVALSTAIHLLTITAVWCAARAVAAPLDFGLAFLLVPPVTLVSTIPISIAGWGLREGAMMAVFTYAGLLDADGLIVSVLFGVCLFAVGAIGGLIWILGSERNKFPTSADAPETQP